MSTSVQTSDASTATPVESTASYHSHLGNSAMVAALESSRSEATRPEYFRRQQKLENEQRRANIWQAGGMAPSSMTPATQQPAAQRQNQTSTSRRRGLGSFLEEKQQIAGRSLRRMSSRRSLLSDSQHSTDSNAGGVSTFSEKTAISERSNRRIKAREAAARTRNEPEYQVDPMTMGGTAEMVLPTVSETASQHSMEQSQRSDGSPPQHAHDTSWYTSGGACDLITAVVVDDNDDEEIFVSDIPYATEVLSTPEKNWRLPALMCLALACLVVINIVIVGVVLKSHGSENSSTDSSVLQTDVPVRLPPMDTDGDAVHFPSISPNNIIPTPPPSPRLNNGRPASSEDRQKPDNGNKNNKPTRSNNSSGNNGNNGNNNGRPKQTLSLTPSSSPSSLSPSEEPTLAPSAGPSVQPTVGPSSLPSTTVAPVAVASIQPRAPIETAPPTSFSSSPTTQPATTSPTQVPSTESPTMQAEEEKVVVIGRLPTLERNSTQTSTPGFRPTFFQRNAQFP